MTLVISILVVTTIKFLGLDIEESTLSPFIKNAFRVIYKHVFWIAALPLVVYLVLDYYVAYIHRGRSEEKQTAIRFFVLVDLVCVLPLALAYVLSIVHAEFITG